MHRSHGTIWAHGYQPYRCVMSHALHGGRQTYPAQFDEIYAFECCTYEGEIKNGQLPPLEVRTNSPVNVLLRGGLQTILIH